MAYLLESDGYAKHVQGFIDSCQINIKILTEIKLKLLDVSFRKLNGISLKSAFSIIKNYNEYLKYLTNEYNTIKEMREFWRKTIISTTIHINSLTSSTNDLLESTNKYSLNVDFFLEISDKNINDISVISTTLDQYFCDSSTKNINNKVHHSREKISSIISIIEDYIVKFETLLNDGIHLKLKNEVWRKSAILETQHHIIDVYKTGFVRNPTTDVSLHDAKWPSDSSAYVHKS